MGIGQVGVIGAIVILLVVTAIAHALDTAQILLLHTEADTVPDRQLNYSRVTSTRAPVNYILCGIFCL